MQSPFETLLQHPGADNTAQISVAISCFKYGREATDALDSLLHQTEETIDVIIVDDCSPDGSAAVILNWFKRNPRSKFGNIQLVRHLDNQGLTQSRNTALTLTSTPYIFILDADNQLYPRALKTLREALERSGCAMAYSLIEKFGDEQGLINNSLWLPSRFSHHNYIDAMALIRTDVLRQLGGYRIMPDKFGWEDYDLWCSFVDHGLEGCHVPQILCRYRVHGRSMLRTHTDSFRADKMDRIRKDFEAHHKMPFFFH